MWKGLGLREYVGSLRKRGRWSSGRAMGLPQMGFLCRYGGYGLNLVHNKNGIRKIPNRSNCEMQSYGNLPNTSGNLVPVS